MKRKYLTKEEEVELFKEYKSNTSKERKLEIRNLLIEKNLGLVYKLAQKFSSFDVDYMFDLANEGVFGLIDAIENFDIKKDVKFSTFAFFYINQKISLYLADKIKMIRVPYRKKDKSLTFVESMDAETDENIKQYGYKDEFEILLEDKELKEVLLKAINEILTDKEAYIIKNRFNFDDNKKDTLEEVGKSLGFSRERARQLETKAILKIKRYFNETKELEGYINKIIDGEEKWNQILS